MNLYELVMENGGATVRLADGALITHGDALDGKMPSGYIVGMVTDSWSKFPLTGNSDEDAQTLDVFAQRARVQFPEMGADAMDFWLDENVVYIDPVRILGDKSYAFGYADGTRQRAIYNLTTGKTIYMKGKDKK